LRPSIRSLRSYVPDKGIKHPLYDAGLVVVCDLYHHQFTVSYNTPKPTPEVIDNYTWSNPLAVVTRDAFKGLKDVRFWAGILLITLVVLYIIF
jgi:SSS family solute:Na+ symporter